MEKLIAVVETYNKNKGWGFLTFESRKIFFHKSAANFDNEEIEVGVVVMFLMSSNSKGECAISIDLHASEKEETVEASQPELEPTPTLENNPRALIKKDEIRALAQKGIKSLKIASNGGIKMLALKTKPAQKIAKTYLSRALEQAGRKLVEISAKVK